MNTNCRDCRAEMCTDGLLSKLRCAECRQIEFERFSNVVFKAGLILSVGYLALNLLTARSDPPGSVSSGTKDPHEPSGSVTIFGDSNPPRIGPCSLR